MKNTTERNELWDLIRKLLVLVIRLQNQSIISDNLRPLRRFHRRSAHELVTLNQLREIQPPIFNSLEPWNPFSQMSLSVESFFGKLPLSQYETAIVGPQSVGLTSLLFNLAGLHAKEHPAVVFVTSKEHLEKYLPVSELSDDILRRIKIK